MLSSFSVSVVPVTSRAQGGAEAHMDKSDGSPKKKKKWRPRRKRVLSDWMVVKTKPHQERYAAKNVRRQGHACIAPFVTEEDSRKEVPLFAGFIFVQGPAWHYLKGTYGVVYPIMMGDKPALMPLREMRDILRRVGEDDVITIKAEKFSPGQHIKFRRGAWLGYKGVYNKAVGKNRVRILLRLLGGQHELEFDRGDITADDTEGK